MELVPCAVQNAGQKHSIIPKNDVIKGLNKSTVSGGSTTPEEDKVYRASNNPLLSDNRNEIKEENNGSLAFNLILHTRQVQKMVAHNRKSFGTQHISGNNFAENADSNVTILQDTDIL